MNRHTDQYHILISKHLEALGSVLEGCTNKGWVELSQSSVKRFCCHTPGDHCSAQCTVTCTNLNLAVDEHSDGNKYSIQYRLQSGNNIQCFILRWHRDLRHQVKEDQHFFGIHGTQKIKNSLGTKMLVQAEKTAKPFARLQALTTSCVCIHKGQSVCKGVFRHQRSGG